MGIKCVARGTLHRSVRRLPATSLSAQHHRTSLDTARHSRSDAAMVPDRRRRRAGRPGAQRRAVCPRPRIQPDRQRAARLSLLDECQMVEDGDNLLDRRLVAQDDHRGDQCRPLQRLPRRSGSVQHDAVRRVLGGGCKFGARLGHLDVARGSPRVGDARRRRENQGDLDRHENGGAPHSSSSAAQARLTV